MSPIKCMIDQLMARASLLLTKSEIFLQTFSIPLHTRYFLLDKNGSKSIAINHPGFKLLLIIQWKSSTYLNPMRSYWKLGNWLTCWHPRWNLIRSGATEGSGLPPINLISFFNWVNWKRTSLSSSILLWRMPRIWKRLSFQSSDTTP